MARDHRKLRVFHDAHRQVLAIYKETRSFPRDEWYALRQQLRKAAVSIPSNIVEGNARRTAREYVHFLNIARGSASEVVYLVDLASELLQSMELLLLEEEENKRVRRRTPKTRDRETED
jgi:four helix bundle protein